MGTGSSCCRRSAHKRDEEVIDLRLSDVENAGLGAENRCFDGPEVTEKNLLENAYETVEQTDDGKAGTAPSPKHEYVNIGPDSKAKVLPKLKPDLPPPRKDNILETEESNEISNEDDDYLVPANRKPHQTENSSRGDNETEDPEAGPSAVPHYVEAENSDPRIKPIDGYVEIDKCEDLESNLERCRVLNSYSKKQPDQISLCSNDSVKINEYITNESVEELMCVVTCEARGKRGLVPRRILANVGSLEEMRWYFGDIERAEAERLLLASNIPGKYLIRRKKSTKAGKDSQQNWDYVLSVIQPEGDEGKTFGHYQIQSILHGTKWIYYLSDQKEFSELEELIRYYSGNTKPKLTSPCSKRVVLSDLKLEPTKDKEENVYERIEIGKSRIELGEKLGSGRFATVFKGTMDGKFCVAVKILREADGYDLVREEMVAFEKEVKALLEAQHDQLVRFYGVCTQEEPCYLVTEFMVNGNLKGYLSTGPGSSLNLKELLDIARQVSLGMEFLESRKCVHRDLAARNVLVGENNKVKIADFGLARHTDGIYFPSKDTLLPAKWTAPEGIGVHNKDNTEVKRYFTSKSDVWSFGILMVEIITHGKEPYPDMQPEDVYISVQAGESILHPKPEECPQDLYANLIVQCLEMDPKERPTFKDYIVIFLEQYLFNMQ